MSPCCGCAFRFLRLRRQNHTTASTSAMPITGPTTAPAIQALLPDEVAAGVPVSEALIEDEVVLLDVDKAADVAPVKLISEYFEYHNPARRTA